MNWKFIIKPKHTEQNQNISAFDTLTNYIGFYRQKCISDHRMTIGCSIGRETIYFRRHSINAGNSIYNATVPLEWEKWYIP